MNRCIRCHRPMKHATESGFGPVCGKRALPVPTHERDLFGFDIEKAAQAALYRVGVHIESLAAEARGVLRQAFRGARKRLGVTV